MRKLASIQKIINIQPIVGADKIELATVLGTVHRFTGERISFKVINQEFLLKESY